MSAGKKTLWYRSLLGKDQVIVVNVDQFISMKEAQSALKLRSQIGINTRIANGYLLRAATKEGPWHRGDIGITRDSLDIEIQRSSTETFIEKWKRRFRFIGNSI